MTSGVKWILKNTPERKKTKIMQTISFSHFLIININEKKFSLLF